MYKTSGISICIESERESFEKISLKKYRAKHKELDIEIPDP